MNLERDPASTPETGTGGEDLSSLPDPEHYSADDPEPIGNPERSLIADVEDFFFDAKTYVDAELNYQKTRARYAGISIGNTIAYAVIGAALGLVALIALSVGLIISLAPLLTPWGATALVTALLALAVAFSLRRAAASWRDFGEAMSERRADEAEDEA